MGVTACECPVSVAARLTRLTGCKLQVRTYLHSHPPIRGCVSVSVSAVSRGSFGLTGCGLEAPEHARGSLADVAGRHRGSRAGQVPVLASGEHGLFGPAAREDDQLRFFPGLRRCASSGCSWMGICRAPGRLGAAEATSLRVHDTTRGQHIQHQLRSHARCRWPCHQACKSRQVPFGRVGSW